MIGREWIARIGFGLAITVPLSGCEFRTLRKNLEVASELTAVEGRADIRGGGSAPIVVVAYGVSAGKVVDMFVLPRPGPFFFVLPAGTYRLGAFEDRNRDLAYEAAEEPAVLFANPTDVVLEPGDRRKGLDVIIDPNASTQLPFGVSLASEQHEINQLPAPQLGTIVDIDDARFSEENGKLGMWNPLQFLATVGAGVYFLEEYDPKKTPVLFVHGATGNPNQFKYLVSHIDRSRFQPWLAYYPSAPHLERIGQSLVRTLSALQVKYNFQRLILVAHSMGGLVTRGAINYAFRSVGSTRVVHIPAFVSISSPWNGHAAAAKGAEYSPIVAPSWEDMVPGSPFIQSLPETPLPPECEYSLFFSYRGGTGLGGEANDGTVTVASELSMPIQRQAVRVMGFNEDHDSILTNPDLAAQLNAILARVAQ
ncbi:MAG TPA: alpha/beta hydrolase [Candidatus Binatia bacterium]|nr:alpha/beta hydrolase [Candidatus Binatia bacterium]